MMERFEGLYFKHQNADQTLSVIVGRSMEDAFVQIITDNCSNVIRYPRSAYKKGRQITLGGCEFGLNAIKLNIIKDDIRITGRVIYHNLTPPLYDIMGPFRLLPMECRHQIISLYHNLSGSIELNGDLHDFTDGIGYIEGDSGRSFPSAYTWLHSNDFSEPASVFLSTADIPFLGQSFKGCIGIIYTRGKQYRIATYLGAKVLESGRDAVRIKQGALLLEVFPQIKEGYELKAPSAGKMSRIIKECVSSKAAIRLSRNGHTVFAGTSERTSMEFVP